MSDRSNDICPTFYQEDVAVSGTGTVLLGHPSTVWSVNAVLETTGTVVLSFSDDATGYNPAHRIGKIVFSGPDTEAANISKGWSVTRGLSCISSIGSVDVYGVYE